MRCRICRTARNLKYTPQQIRLQTKNRDKNKLRLPLSAIPQTTGNICIDCDERLQNFHQLDDETVVDVDSDSFHENKMRPIEMPIIVDDDERLFDMFYNKTGLHSNETKQTTSMKCKTQSLGSDGDAEVIEVLTSRETTPDMMAGFNENGLSLSSVKPPNPTVIDVIDLEEYDEIVRVNRESEQHANCNKSTGIEEKETRLLGCLNLVSSDSESEINFEPCPRENEVKAKITELQTKIELSLNKTDGIENVEVECTNNNNNMSYKDSGVTIKHSLPVCGVCGISCLDKPSLKAHIRCEHEILKCLVCSDHFPLPLDLVNHMRQKHRSYDGHELCEGARCSQDSAMTIRLRFRQRFTFYECQLCGLIESQFKSHKTHIMQKHADESKSLRDPMMKAQLKCPSCHQSCGTQPIDICRHLLYKHENVEGMKYLKEITDISALDLSKKYFKNLQHGTRFLALGSHKQFFFECLLCQKVFSSKNSIMKHLNGHNINDWKEYKAEELSKDSNTSSDISVPERALKRKIETRNVLKTDDISKKGGQPPAKKPKLEYESRLLKTTVKTKKDTQPKDSKSKTVEITVQKHAPPTPIPPNVKPCSFTLPDLKRQKKLKHKLDKNSQNKRSRTKAPTVTKVKVKPPLRHFPTQKYNCKHCQLTFKGFRKLQLHLLSSHRSEEYHSCGSCARAFVNKDSLEIHYTQNICRRQRKNTSLSRRNKETKDNKSDNDNIDENFNKDDRKSCTYELKSAIEEPLDKQSSNASDPIWLKELLQLSRENKFKNINNESKSTAIEEDFDDFFLGSQHEQFNTVVRSFCRFCGELFSTIEEFSVHEKNHKAQKDMPWIHFSQRSSELSLT